MPRLLIKDEWIDGSSALHECGRNAAQFGLKSSAPFVTGGEMGILVEGPVSKILDFVFERRCDCDMCEVLAPKTRAEWGSHVVFEELDIAVDPITHKNKDFRQFQATRRLCTDELSHSWEGDLPSRGHPRFHYTANKLVNKDTRSVLYLSILICPYGGFDIQYDGYPAFDYCTSLEQAEQRLWNCALSEQWGVQGEPMLVRKLVKIEQLPLQKTEQRQFVDVDEYLTTIRWTDLLSHLMDIWSITARYCGNGEVELVGDGDQIDAYLKENTPE